MKKILYLLILVLFASNNLYTQPDAMFRGNPSHNKNYTGFNDKIFYHTYCTPTPFYKSAEIAGIWS